MKLRVELEQEDDGRWIAEVVNWPEVTGLVAYGATQWQAFRAVEALALRVIAERLELEQGGETPFEMRSFSFEPA